MGFANMTAVGGLHSRAHCRHGSDRIVNPKRGSTLHPAVAASDATAISMSAGDGRLMT